MFNKNVFTQKDPIADLIKGINEADYKAKMEALKGNQTKIDKNHNNKIDADDFKILRGEKKAMKEEEQVEEGWDDMLKAAKERSKPQPSGGSGVKLGSRYGGGKQKDKPEHDTDEAGKKTQKEEIDPNVEVTDTLKGEIKGKSANPFLKPKVKLNVNEEELDERTLTPGETEKKEKIVHGMKKSLAGFKARYGDRAKSVMYATATKAAKNEQKW